MKDTLNMKNNFIYGVQRPRGVDQTTNQNIKYYYIDQQNSTKANKTELVDYLQKSGGTMTAILNVGWGWK